MLRGFEVEDFKDWTSLIVSRASPSFRVDLKSLLSLLFGMSMK